MQGSLVARGNTPNAKCCWCRQRERRSLCPDGNGNLSFCSCFWQQQFHAVGRRFDVDSSSSSVQIDGALRCRRSSLPLPMQRIRTLWHCSGTFSCHFNRRVIWRLMHDAYFGFLLLELFVALTSRLDVLSLLMTNCQKKSNVGRHIGR